MQRRAAREVVDVAASMQPEFVDDVQRLVLDDVEIGVVAVARHGVSVLAVPFGVLHADVFGGDHLAVEHQLLGAVFLVVTLDQPQYVLHESDVVVVVVDADSQKFGGFDQSVYADGQVLARKVDVARIEERQHAFGLQFLEVFVVSRLYFVYQIRDLFQIGEIVHAVLHGVLDAAVEVDRQHALRAGRDAARAERVAEPVVLNLVPQTAAARQRVGVVADIGEERVPLGVHLRRDVAPLPVHHVAVFGQQRHRLYRESQHGLGALAVEPPHETLLQPRQRLPVRMRTVGKYELPEQAFEVVAVVVGHVPEHGLEVARPGRLVDRVDDLFEAVGDYLVYCPAFLREVGHLVGPLVVIFAVLLLDEIVHVHQEFGRGACARKHRRHDENHVDESAAERFEVRRTGRVAAHRKRAAQEPRIHGDRGAVVGHRRLVVLVDEVLLEQVQVFVRQLLAVHLLDAVGQQAAVQADEVLLRQLADQRGDVLVFDVGVGVVFRAGRRVRGVAVVDQKFEFLAVFALFGVFLAVEHVALGHREVTLGHQRHFDLILNLFYAHAVGHVYAAQYRRDVVVGGVAADRKEGLAYGAFDFLDGKRFALAVAFYDVKFGNAHIFSCFVVGRLCDKARFCRRTAA